MIMDATTTLYGIFFCVFSLLAISMHFPLSGLPYFKGTKCIQTCVVEPSATGDLESVAESARLGS